MTVNARMLYIKIYVQHSRSIDDRGFVESSRYHETRLVLSALPLTSDKKRPMGTLPFEYSRPLHLKQSDTSNMNHLTPDTQHHHDPRSLISTRDHRNKPSIIHYHRDQLLQQDHCHLPSSLRKTTDTTTNLDHHRDQPFSSSRSTILTWQSRRQP